MSIRSKISCADVLVSQILICNYERGNPQKAILHLLTVIARSGQVCPLAIKKHAGNHPRPCRNFSRTTVQMLSLCSRVTKSALSRMISGMVMTPKSVTHDTIAVKYTNTCSQVPSISRCRSVCAGIVQCKFYNSMSVSEAQRGCDRTRIFRLIWGDIWGGNSRAL